LAELLGLYKNPVPDGATTGYVKIDERVRLRYARWAPTSSYVRGTVVLVQGRAEYIEKYFETVSDLRRRGFWVATFDWRGQGGSSRDLQNHMKGHIWDFAQYDSDLHNFMHQIVYPDCPAPYYALGHSLGGHNLLRLAGFGLCQFDRMVLSAPMVGLSKSILKYPKEIVTLLMTLTNWSGFGEAYVPGGTDQNINLKPFEANKLSSDLERYTRNAEVLQTNLELSVGSPTASWLVAALHSMNKLMQSSFHMGIKTPILLIGAGSDRVVSNIASREFADRLKNCSYLIIPNARHEILQETNFLRDQFWAAFDSFIPGEAFKDEKGEAVKDKKIKALTGE